MNPSRRFGAFSSSENPDQLAARVKAVILGSSGLIIFAVGKIFHIELNPSDVVALATDASFVVASIFFTYGICKKWTIWAIDKWHTRTI